ncbi:MAG TPA: nucleotidyltransferase family protein [Candidatus Binataceae bacterium]
MAIAPRIEGLLLAAGESRRMGYPKPLLRLGDESFLSRSAHSMLAVLPRLIIVLGAHAERIRRVIPIDSRIAVVENPRWQAGKLSSLKAGIGAIGAQTDGVMVHLADHPLVQRSTFERVITEFMTGQGAIVIARYAGKRGHPVIFARSMMVELLDAPEDEGARAVVNRNPSRVVYVDLDDPGVNLDLDTPADLEQAGLPGPPKA